MKKVKKEVSTTGGIAGYNGRIGAPGNPSEEELKRWKKQKGKLVNRKKKPKAKPFKENGSRSKNVNEAVDKLIKESIVKVLLEQSPNDERMAYIIRLFEGISKNLNVSLGYTRMFILDALKMDVATGAAKLNAQRASTELNHIRKMINDLDSLIAQIYKVNQENQHQGEG